MEQEYLRPLNEIYDRVLTEPPLDDYGMWRLMARYPDRSFLVFAQDREHPLHFADRLPQCLSDRDPDTWRGDARPGEHFTFQLAVWSGKVDLKNVVVSFTDFTGDGATLPAGAFTCYNQQGTDTWGRHFFRGVDVPVGRAQALWVGADIPADCPAGNYEGIVTVRADRFKPAPVKVCLRVGGEPLADGGVGEPWRHARLKWLNSTLALDGEVTAPYVPLRREGQVLSYLGRRTALGGGGLPAALTSFFNPVTGAIGDAARDVLSGPIRFIVETDEGVFPLSGAPRFTREDDGCLAWRWEGEMGGLSLTCEASLEAEGMHAYRIAVTARRDVEIRDVRLEIPWRRDAARFAMGLGLQGGFRSGEIDWKWDKTLNQDTLWMGDVGAGLWVRLRDADYIKPLMIFYYMNTPLTVPEGWDNGGRGGIRVKQTGETVGFTAASGPRRLAAGQCVDFCFDLFVTPVKPTDRTEHYGDRYYHAVPEDVALVKEAGCNVVNVHHGNDLCPFINYPYIGHRALRDFVSRAHEQDLKVKLYYTVREHTHRMAEFWALRSLGGEVIADGCGIGFFPPGRPAEQVGDPHRPDGRADRFLRDYLGDHYIPAWKSVLRTPGYKGQMECAVVATGDSRYNNYYVEDVAWLLEHTGIDGLYYDDMNFDHTVLRRVRKVLDRHHSGCRIDLHSWNHWKDNTLDDARFAGWGNSANLYVPFFPYIDRIWFGEGYVYDRGPDTWLVEMSGLPFGMMGEMLQDGGNPWRGMLFGMTGRMPRVDARGLWRLWDDFAIGEADLLGWWDADCPVRPQTPDVYATVYRRPGKALIAVASWAQQDMDCSLSIDWDALGIDGVGAKLTAPAVEGFQPGAVFDPCGPLPVGRGKGWLLLLEQADAEHA